MTSQPDPARIVTVVLPCRNEAGALPEVLRRIPSGYQVIAVDNNSTDATAAVAARLGARVVAEQVAGYGAAVHAGIVAAPSGVVCVLDADGSVDPAELPAMVSRHTAGADLVVGRRVPAPGARPPWPARLGNALVTRRLRQRYGLRVHDVAAIRVCDRDRLLELGIADRRFGYPVELLVRAAEAGWRVEELPVRYMARIAGTSKVSGSVTGTLRTARDFAAALR